MGTERLRATPAAIRQAISKTEADLAEVHERIQGRLAEVDEDERYAISLEQKIAALNGFLQERSGAAA